MNYKMTTLYHRYRYHHDRVRELATQSPFLNTILILNQRQLEQYIHQTMHHLIEIQRDSYFRSILVFYGHVLGAWRGRVSYRDRRIKRAMSTDSGHEHQIVLLKRLGKRCCSVIKYLQLVRSRRSRVEDYRTDYGILECEDLPESVETPEIVVNLKPSETSPLNELEVPKTIDVDESALQEMIFRTLIETCQYFCDISYVVRCLSNRTLSTIKFFKNNPSRVPGLRDDLVEAASRRSPISSFKDSYQLMNRHIHNFLVMQIRESDINKPLQKRMIDNIASFMINIRYEEHGTMIYEQQVTDFCNNCKFDAPEILQLCQVLTGDEKQDLENFAAFVRDPIVTTNLCIRRQLAEILSIQLGVKCTERERSGKTAFTIWQILRITPEMSADLKSKIEGLKANFGCNEIEENERREEYPPEFYPVNINPYHRRYARVLFERLECQELLFLCRYYSPDHCTALEPILEILKVFAQTGLTVTSEIRPERQAKTSRLNVRFGLSKIS